MKYCLEVWGTNYEKIKEICILAEKLEYDGFFYGETLSDIDLDCWTVLSSLASLTKIIKLGPVITYLFPQYRHISLLAKQALTFQNISKGRLEFRTGAGAILQYSRQWWNPYGIKYPKISDRIEILEEGLKVLKMFWNHNDNQILSPVKFDGKYFKINNAVIKIPNIQTKNIPITVAARQEKTMNIASRYADTWESSYISPQEFLELNQNFNNIIYKYNESKISTIQRSIELDVLIAESDDDLKHKERLFAVERGPNKLYYLKQRGLIGFPHTIIQRIKEYVDAGVNQFFLAFQNPFDVKSIKLFNDTVKNVI